MTVAFPWYELGYVIPHLYTDLDAYQFYRVAPDGMVLVTTQLNLKDYTIAAVEDELATLWQRFELLARRGVNRISLSGVPVAAALGRQRVLGILEEARLRTRLPCDTDLEAHISALQHLGATTIALATRWSAAVNQALTRYLAEAGIQVLACRSHARTLEQNKHARAEDDHQLALDLVRQVVADAPTAQAILLPGGLWFAVHAVPVLEAELNRVVLTNIISTTWAALAAAGDGVKHRPDPARSRLLASI
ncbi:MAG: hypothetical protein IT307_02015 [Chloroflexi bacterium]|nr:hypothetical protein [Chloroflexota bacterium]